MIDQIERDDEQIIEIVDYDFGVSRRTFVQIVGAGLLIAATSGPILAQERPRGGRSGGGQSRPVNLDARLHIGKDGTITVMTGKVEGGQGARAEITQAAAEELDVPIGRVQLVMGDTDLVPDDGITAGSRTTPSTLPSVRAACATAHDLLVAFAKGDPTRTYTDLAAADATALKQAAARGVVVTPAKEWNVLGVSTSRPGARDIVVGAHQYPADVIRPGMLYGKILRAPSYGAKLTSIDLEKAKELGVTVVRDKSFVGVAAHNTAAAKQAIAALEESAKWDQPAHPSSKKLFDHLREHARGEVPTSPFKDEIAASAKRVTATFHVPYVQHCPMEPRAAVAEWDKDGKVTIWTSTQNPFGVRREVAGAFHIPEEKVRIIVPDFGGGFGGKHTGETAVEAARLAQAAKAPVAVRWTRPEELTWAAFRSAAVIDVDGTLSKEGKLTSWHMVSINPGRSGVETPYQAGKTSAQTIESEPPLGRRRIGRSDQPPTTSPARARWMNSPPPRERTRSISVSSISTTTASRPC